MNIAEVYGLLKPEVGRINDEIFGNVNSAVERVNEISRYILDSGGKRLRPLLVVLASRYCDGDIDRAIRLGGVVEYIHTATLLHDDVIDEAQVRRGQSSANRRFGNEGVILAGDYLYSRAFQVLVDDGDPRVQRTLSSTTTLMAEGEVMQLVKSFNFDISFEDYYSIIEHKTAILIAACAQVGAYTGTQDEDVARRFRDYGYNIGMAFQIMDDILDYFAQESQLGKSVGTDLREGKMTIPLLCARDRANAEENQRLRSIIERRELPVAEDMQFVLGLMNAHGVRDTALTVGTDFVDRARAALAPLPDNLYKEALLSVADYVLDRPL